VVNANVPAMVDVIRGERQDQVSGGAVVGRAGD
jgi:hypothetical protein